MPVQRVSTGRAARGVAAASDNLRVQYSADGTRRVRGIVVTAKANGAAPTAAQQNGCARVVVTVGKARDGASVIAATGGQDASAQEGTVIADCHIPMVYLGAHPSVIPLFHRMESGDTITVEVTNGVDNAGAAFDVDAGVTINVEPSAYNVTG